MYSRCSFQMGFLWGFDLCVASWWCHSPFVVLASHPQVRARAIEAVGPHLGAGRSLKRCGRFSDLLNNFSLSPTEEMERNSEAVVKRCHDGRLILHYNVVLRLDEYPLKRGPWTFKTLYLLWVSLGVVLPFFTLCWPFFSCHHFPSANLTGCQAPDAAWRQEFDSLILSFQCWRTGAYYFWIC